MLSLIQLGNEPKPEIFWYFVKFLISPPKSCYDSSPKVANDFLEVAQGVASKRGSVGYCLFSYLPFKETAAAPLNVPNVYYFGLHELAVVYF
jgi:hypothetical protein